MKIKLYEFGPTRSIRVRWTLQELGLAFESVRINLLAGEHRRPEFLKINPAGKIPVLVDDAVVLTESVAIVLYLSEKYADKRLVPSTVEARAQINRWLLFAATELEQPLWRISRHTTLYPEEERCPKKYCSPVGISKKWRPCWKSICKDASSLREIRDHRRFCDGLHPRLGQRG